MLRTITGQTGKDAYKYELQGLANAKRSLERKMTQLIDAICDELPADAKSSWRMTSDHSVEVDKANIIRMLEMWRDSVDPVAFETVKEIIDNLQVGEAK